MNLKKRYILAVVILLAMIGIMLGVDFLQRRQAERKMMANIPAGSVPVLINGNLAASFVPGDLDQLEKTSFVDSEEGKTQEGWLLRDVLLLYLREDQDLAGSVITVSSSSREKFKTLDWDILDEVENFVLFDLSGRGTLKLVSNISGFDTRDDWIQDVDRIEVTNSGK